jgi:hypothetical protein
MTVGMKRVDLVSWLVCAQLLAFLACLLPAAPAHATPVTVTVDSFQATAGDVARVPVLVEGARDIGALHLELQYDPSVLSVESVENGTLPAARNAMLEFNAGAPGRVVIGLISVDGIQGDGAIAIITFKATGRSGQKTTLELQQCRAWETKSHFDILVDARSGSAQLTGISGAKLLPWILLAAAIVLLFLIVALALLLRGRKNTQPAPRAPVPTGARIPPARLLVTGGGIDSSIVELPVTGLTIGRATSNHLVLSDALASGQHAYLCLTDGQWVITDLNSTNGTYVNGHRLGPGAWGLRSGDRIQIGQASLMFVSP